MLFDTVNPQATSVHGSAFLCLLVAFLITAGGASAQGNINGSFESTPTGVVTDLAAGVEGWSLTINDDVDPDPVFEIVGEGAQEGDNALAVTVNASGENPWHIEATATPVAVIPGATYQYSVWAKSETDGGTAHFTVGNNEFSEYTAIRDAGTLTTEWQEFTVEFTINDEETSIRAPIHFSFDGNVGNTIYIDNLVIDGPSPGALPVVVEAEDSPDLDDEANEFDEVVGGEDEPTYITISTEFNETTGSADYPGANRTASYEVTFAEAGWYDLFARVYVGPAGFDDDSFFYADSFGTKDPALAEDWINANQLNAAGYVDADDYVSGLGAEGGQIWKWVNLSENSFNEVPSDSFYVTPEELTVTFEIGARENGLQIDKFAFGKSGLFYTVGNLENGEPGATEMDGVDIELPEEVLAHDLDKFLGNIYSASQTENFEYYWNYVIAENAGKWGSVEGTRDEMSWGGLDAAYALAQDNGFPFNFHVLLWGAQQPNWISDLEPNEQLEEIREWMVAVNERYPDMDVVQVANEILPTHNPPDGQNGRADYKDALGGDGETGYDYVIEAFRMAREIFGDDQRLMLNDYGILGSTNAARQYVEIIELLQEEDLIDVIGVQGHAFSTRAGAPIDAVLDILAETGLPIQVTEMDVDGNPNVQDITDEASDQNQLVAMQRIFPTIWEHPAVEGITFWGWRPGLWRTDEEAYLVRSTGEHRPALDWLQDYLDDYRQSVATESGVELAAVRLLGNYPNPFAGITRIQYVLAEPTDVTLEVFDIVGRTVATLVSGRQAAGEQSVPFVASGLSSGVYLYRLEAGQEVQTGRMVITQ